MIRNLKDSDRINMTSFWGDTIYTSAREISEKLGVKVTRYDGDKINFEFQLETEDGIPFTVYDWKESPCVTEDTRLHYHIGAHNEVESGKATLALTEQMKAPLRPASKPASTEKMVYIVSCDDLWEYISAAGGDEETINDVDINAVSDEDYKNAVAIHGWVLSLNRFVEVFNADNDLCPTPAYHYIRIF